MKKKSISLQKLPLIFSQKKEVIIQKSKRLEQKIRLIEEQDKINIQNNKLESFILKQPSFTLRYFSQKKSQSERKLNKNMFNQTKQMEKSQFTPLIKKNIKQSDDKYNLNKRSSLQKLFKQKTIMGAIHKTSNISKIDLKQIKQSKEFDNVKQKQVKSFKQRNSLFIPEIDMIQKRNEKKLLPFYQSEHYQNTPFIKLKQVQRKAQIRFINGFQKWIQTQKLLANSSSQRQAYIVNNANQKDKQMEQEKQKEQILDKSYLNSLLQKVIKNQQNINFQIIEDIKQELYYNYDTSSKLFINTYRNKKIKNHKIYMNKNKKDFENIKSNLNIKYLNSERLSFLSDFNLSKDKYLIDIVKCQAFVSQLKGFKHFSIFYNLNIKSQQQKQNQESFLNNERLIEKILYDLKLKRQKIEQKIYKIQTKLSQLKNKITKDLQYYIKLNPRFKQYNYENDLNIFMTDITKYFHIIIQSIISYTLQCDLKEFQVFLVKCAQNQIHSIQIPGFPSKTFYNNIFVLNYLILSPIQQNRKKSYIFHAPGIQTIELKLNKLKRKKYSNIYKFLIDSRKLIRQFELQQPQFQKKMQKLEINQNQQKFSYQKSNQIFLKIIQNPISLYIKDIQNSQNVFGCINNSKIKVLLMHSIEFKKTKDKIKQLFQEMEAILVTKYIKFFDLWEIYFTDKIYIQDILLIYRRLNSTNLIRQQVQNLKKDLKLIKKFPVVIEYKYLRINIKDIKEKIETIIQSNINKLLKASQDNLSKLLDYGYQQTEKVKKLNQVTKYTNIAEYIAFIALLNKREAQKSIHKIAENVVVINSNMALLQDNFYEIKFSTIKQYLQCRQWVKDLRKNSIQNQKKISLDPYTFMKGIKQKKQKIYGRYLKIIKDIIQIMKVNEVTKFNRYNALAQNIDQQLKQIFNLTKTIDQDQQLLEFKYQQEETYSFQMNQNKLIKLDFTFFHLESLFLQKYLQFWTFVSKFKHFLQSDINTSIVTIQGAALIQTVRQGQQLLFKIKHSTLNKRFLNLAQQMNKQLQPFLKNIYLIQICVSGRSAYRILVLKQINNYLNTQIAEQSITLKQFVTFNLTGLLDSQSMKTIYRLREKQKYKLQILKKISSVGQILKTFQVKTKMLKGVGNTRQLNIIAIQQNLFQTVQYLLSIMREFKQTAQFKTYLLHQQTEQQQFLQVQKKLLIFQKSIIKMKKCEQSLPTFYSLFQFLYPQIQSLEAFSFCASYKVIYENTLLDYYKKSQLIVKLSFTTIYNDKVKINYDMTLSQLEQFKTKLYNTIIPYFLDSINNLESQEDDIYVENKLKQDNQKLNYLHLNNYKMQLFQILCNIQNLKNSEINLVLSKLFRSCKKADLALEYDSTQGQLYLNLKSILSLNQDKIIINHRQKLFQITKLVSDIKQPIQKNQNFRSYKLEFGLIKSIRFLNSSLRKIHKNQTKQYLHLVYQSHYNVKSLFQIYFSVEGILLQSIITCLNVMFYLDLSLVWQNKYDLNLFYTFLKSKIEDSYQSKQEENLIYLQQIKTILQGFKSLVKYLLDHQAEDKNELSKLQKTILMYFVPKIQISAFNYSTNKYKTWLKQIKQSAQDNFLSYTHQIPFIKQIGVPILELGKVDIRQIQKKQAIIFLQLLQKCQNNFTLNLIVKFPILKYLEVSYQMAFGWEPLGQKIETDNFYFYQKQYATSLLIYSYFQQKILIVNQEIDTSILGINFIKTECLYPNLAVNQIMIINSYNDLLRTMKEFIQFKKLQKNKLEGNKRQNQKNKKRMPIIYFLFSDLNVQNIKEAPGYQENFITFQIKCNNIRYIINEEPSKLELDMISYFSKDREMAKTLLIYDECSQHPLIDDYRVKKINVKRDKQQLKNLIWQYHKEKGFTPQATQFSINCINFQIFFVDSLTQIRTQIYDIYCYLKHSQIQNVNLQNSIKGKIQKQKQSIHLYVLGIHQISQNQLFGVYQTQDKKVSYNEQQKSQSIISKQKPKYSKGLLQTIIQSSIQNGDTNDKILSQYMIRGDKSLQSLDKWFVFDFQINNQHSIRIYQRLINLFKKGFFFSDGSLYHVKQLRESFKFIFVTNQKIIKFTTKQKTDLFPFPYLKQHNFNPIRYFQMNITDKFKGLTKQVKKNLIQWFRTFLKIQLKTPKQAYLLQDLMCKQVMQNLMTLFNIHLNQIRKLLLAKGYYNQGNLSTEQSLQNCYGAVQLRDKSKKQIQSYIEYLQKIKQLEQNLKKQRKTIYNKLNNNQSYHKTLKKSAQQQLALSISYFSDFLIPKSIIQTHVKNCLVFCLYYSIIFNKNSLNIFLSKFGHNQQMFSTQLIQQVGSHFLKLIGIKDIKNQCFSNYYYSLSKNSWNYWYQFNTDQLTLDSCSNSFTTLTLDCKQILRLNKSAKMNNIKKYCQFIKKQYKQSPNTVVYKNHLNYFLKICIIYKVPQLIQLNNIQSFYNWSLYRDLLNLKNNNQLKLYGTSMVYNRQCIFKILNQNKRAQKLIKNIQIKKKFLHYQLFVSQTQPSFIQWNTFIKYGFKKIKNQYLKPQNMSFLAIIAPLNQQQKNVRSQESLTFEKIKTPHKDFINVISSVNPQFLVNSSTFRQNFINILMIIKTFENRKVFDRINKIINSSNSVKIQNVSTPRYHLYRLNGIVIKLKQQKQQTQISDSNSFLLNSKNKLTDILNFLMKINDQIEKQDISQIKMSQNQLIGEFFLQSQQKQDDLYQVLKQLKQCQDQGHTSYELIFKLKSNFRVLFNAILQRLSQKLILQFVALDDQEGEFPKNIIRYMVNRPKKYISSFEEQKQKKSKKNRIKQMIRKQQYNDILDFNSKLLLKNKQQYKQFQVFYLNYAKILLFFQLKQNILIVKVEGQFTQNVIQKYVKAYKLYQLSKQINHNKSKQKIFSLKDEENFSKSSNVNQLFYQFLNIFEHISKDSVQNFRNVEQIIKFTKKSLEQNPQSQQQLNYIKVYEPQHIQIVLDQIYQLEKNKYFNQNLINLQNHPYFLIFVPHSNYKSQNTNYFSYCNQICISQNLQNKIKLIYENYNVSTVYYEMFYKKFSLVKRALQIKLKNCFKKQIQNVLFNYVTQANLKFVQLAAYTQKAQSLVQKKLTEIKQTTNNILKLKQNLIKLNNDIVQKQKQQNSQKLSLQKLNKLFQFYIGQTEFKHQNQQIRVITKKVLQKQIQNESYSFNQSNLLYVLMFNVLADNNFFNQKLQDILNLQNLQKKAPMILQSQKKVLAKHVNYGRLAVLIENQEVLYGNFLTEDQLTILQKLRRKFNNAVQIQNHLKETIQYSNQNHMSLNLILCPQIQYIQSLKLSKLQKNLNIYILYLFANKYIKRMTQKKRQNLKTNIKKINDNINSAKERHENQSLQLNQLNNYLLQLEQKIQKCKQEQLQCKKNQQLYLKVLKLNICKITKTFLSFKVGFLISCQLKISEDQNLFKVIQNKLFQSINISQKGYQIIQMLTTFIIFQMTKNCAHKSLSSEQVKLLLFLIQEPIKIYDKESLKNKLDIFLQSCVCQLMQSTNLKVIKHNLSQNIIENNRQQIQSKKYCQSEEIFHFYVTDQKESIFSIFQTEFHESTELKVSNFVLKLIKFDKFMENQVLLFSQKIQKLIIKSSRLIERFQILDTQLISFLEPIINQNDLKQQQRQNLKELQNGISLINSMLSKFLHQFEFTSKRIHQQMFKQVLSEVFAKYNLQKCQIRYHLKLSAFIINSLKRKSKVKQFSKQIFCQVLQKLIEFHKPNLLFSYINNQIDFKKQKKQIKTSLYSQNQIDILEQMDILEQILKSKIKIIFLKFQSNLFNVLSQYSKRFLAQLKYCDHFGYNTNQNIYKNQWFYYQIDQLTSMETLQKFVNQLKDTQSTYISSQKSMKYIFAIYSPSILISPNIYNKINPILYRLSTKKVISNSEVSKLRVKKQSVPNICYQILFNQNFKSKKQQDQNNAQSPKSPSIVRKKMNLKSTQQLRFSYETLIYFFFCVQNISINQISFQIISSYFKQKMNLHHFQKADQISSFKFLLESITDKQQKVPNAFKEEHQHNHQIIKNQISQSFNYLVFVQQQKFQQRNMLKKSVFQSVLKPKINQLEIQQYSNNILSDPYIYLIINKAFRKVISKIIQKRNSIHLPLQSKAPILNQNQQSNSLRSVKTLQQLYFVIFKFSTQCDSLLSDVFLLLRGSHLTKKMQCNRQKFTLKKLEKTKHKQSDDSIFKIIVCKLKFEGCQQQKQLMKIFGEADKQQENSFIVQFSCQKCSEYKIRQKQVGLSMKYYAAKQYIKKQKQQSNSSQFHQKNQFVQKNQYMAIFPIYQKNRGRLIGEFQMSLNFKIQLKPEMSIIIQ